MLSFYTSVRKEILVSFGPSKTLSNFNSQTVSQTEKVFSISFKFYFPKLN